MTRTRTSLAAAALLYGAFWLGANPAAAGGLDAEGRAELEAMRAGDMEKLVFHDEPYEPIEESWVDQYGNQISLADYAGEVVVLNFWATWCPPCLAEMPSLDRLAGRLDGKGAVVIPLSTDRGDAAKIVAFLEEIDAKHITVHHDRSRDVSRRAGILGLPVTALIDPEGREVARLVGDAEWDSTEAVALIERLVELTSEGALIRDADADGALSGDAEESAGG